MHAPPDRETESDLSWGVHTHLCSLPEPAAGSRRAPQPSGRTQQPAAADKGGWVGVVSSSRCSSGCPPKLHSDVFGAQAATARGGRLVPAGRQADRPGQPWQRVTPAQRTPARGHSRCCRPPAAAAFWKQSSEVLGAGVHWGVHWGVDFNCCCRRRYPRCCRRCTLVHHPPTCSNCLYGPHTR